MTSDRTCGAIVALVALAAGGFTASSAVVRTPCVVNVDAVRMACA